MIHTLALCQTYPITLCERNTGSIQVTHPQILTANGRTALNILTIIIDYQSIGAKRQTISPRDSFPVLSIALYFVKVHFAPIASEYIPDRSCLLAHVHKWHRQIQTALNDADIRWHADKHLYRYRPPYIDADIRCSSLCARLPQNGIVYIKYTHIQL